MITLAGFIIGVGFWDFQEVMWWTGAGLFLDALFIYGADE